MITTAMTLLFTAVIDNRDHKARYYSWTVKVKISILEIDETNHLVREEPWLFYATLTSSRTSIGFVISATCIKTIMNDG